MPPVSLGFMRSCNYWISHRELGVAIEEDEVEEENIPDWAQYSGFEENTTGEADGPVEDNDGVDDLGQMLWDVKEDCECEKEVQKLECTLADYKTTLYPGCEQGHIKFGNTLKFL